MLTLNPRPRLLSNLRLGLVLVGRPCGDSAWHVYRLALQGLGQFGGFLCGAGGFPASSSGHNPKPQPLDPGLYSKP